MCILIHRFNLSNIKSRESNARIIEFTEITSYRSNIIRCVLNRILIVGQLLKCLLKSLFVITLVVCLYLLIDIAFGHAAHQSILRLSGHEFTKERTAVEIKESVLPFCAQSFTLCDSILAACNRISDRQICTLRIVTADKSLRKIQSFKIGDGCACIIKACDPSYRSGFTCYSAVVGRKKIIESCNTGSELIKSSNERFNERRKFALCILGICIRSYEREFAVQVT